MDIGLLGPLEVTDAERPITVGGSAQRKLLAVLALEPGAVVPVERLARALYGDDPPANVANALQSHVSRLRRVLGTDVIVSRPPGYALAIDGDDVDAVRFERLVRRAREARSSGEDQVASQLFQQALDLWRGPALVDLLDSDVGRAAAVRLEELAQAAFEERIAADLDLGLHQEVIGELRERVAEQPLREGLWASLMVALYRAGRQADALAAYQDARRTLAEDLGIDPGPELQKLEAAILQHDPSLAAVARPPTSSPAPAAEERPQPRVPASLTTFVGRDDALIELDELLAMQRLVTVTGPGGAGKTRLAVEYAARHDTADGVWFVDLSLTTDGREVAPAIGRALGIDQARVADYLADRKPLIVIDNCEHVLDGVARFLEPLLTGSPGVRVLATSREPLNIAGEVQWLIPPLDLDAAVQLFDDRARTVAPAFDGADGTVADICRRLDGMPLAIELAASRVKAFGVEDIAARLDDRFRLLTSGRRTALPRHQTLRALVDWSYDLLFDDQRVLFELMSVFPGGFAIDAAEAMAERGGLDPVDTIDLIGHLVDKSLVYRVEGSTGTRYRMLETLREYGHARLAASARLEEARRWQAEWCLALAEGAEAQLYGPASAEWLDRLADLEIDNVRAAIGWAVETDNADLGVRLATAFSRPMWERGHQREGRAWLESALDLPTAADLSRSIHVRGLCWLSAISSDHDRPVARAAAERAVRIAEGGEDASLLASAQVMLAQSLIDAGELDGVPRLLDEAAQHLSGWEQGWCQEVACYAALRAGDLDDAEAACLRSLEHHEAMRNPWSASRMRHRLAVIAELRRDYVSAIDEYEMSIDLARPLGVHEVIAVRVGQLSRVLALVGDEARAADLAHEADELLLWLAGVDRTAVGSRRRSDLALARGELVDARAWYEVTGRDDGVDYVDLRLDFLDSAIG